MMIPSLAKIFQHWCHGLTQASNEAQDTAHSLVGQSEKQKKM